MPNNYADISADLRAILDSDCVLSDLESVRPYECDGLAVYREIPRAVVIPNTVAEVARVLRYCNKHEIPIVTRGAGTGLSAGAMPNADGIVLSLAKFTRILEVDPKSRVARVECGVRNLAISDAAREFNLYYAPDPSSQIASTIGGNVAENAGGVHCLKYGVTVHNILEATVVLADGEILTVGCSALDSCGFDLTALITGSEGMLGVIVEITVKLLPCPQTTRLILAAFDDVQRAGDAVSEIVSAGIIPSGLEMMDELAIDAAEDLVHAGYPANAKALVLCELDGDVEEVDQESARTEKLLRNFGATSVVVALSAKKQALLWKGRKSAFPALGRLSPDYYCMDGTIPRNKIAQVLNRIKILSKHYRLRVANVFHAGDGNLHPLILFDANIPKELAKAEALGADILELCVSVGGCITGEHGVGVEKIRQVPLQFSQRELIQLGLIKLAFDPEEMMNPGKGIPILRRCQEYRSTTGRRE